MLSKTGRVIITGVLAILVPVGSSLALGLWYWEGHGASLSRLAKVQRGMTRGQVAALLGTPHSMNRRPDGSESWYYTKWTWCQVKVFVSPEGLVTETDHDH
ncbi:MAG TPA: outer membrane protein assembly factor BamE [Isosphaeraceae bacterium]|jgi:outer membrane protein assembly factor BamE (lipoprotein component of BamABCDE complex)|nr:outer membrane protein assembly factor BamE [Isosphaeraceae bacterium]